MRCEDIQEQLAHYVDGELASADADAVSVHLEGCLACQVDHVALRQARERVTSLPRVKAPEALLAGVKARLAATAPVSAPTASVETHRPPAQPVPAHPVDSLSAFLDNELPTAERDEVREHIAGCGSCAQALVALDDLVGRVRTLPRKTSPGELVGRVLEKIGPQVITAAAPQATVTPISAPPRGRLDKLRQAGGKPVELGPGARRFLAAASLLVFSLGAIAFATPNTSSEVFNHGWHERYPTNGQPLEATARRAEPEPKPTLDPDRTFMLLCESVETAPSALQQLAASRSFSAQPVAQLPNTWTVTGSSAAIRVLASKGGELQVEDPTQFDKVVPAPMDKVQLRTGETYGGVLREEGRSQVVLATLGAGPTPSDPGAAAGRKPLTLTFPRRSVVKVTRASTAPVTIYVVLRKRSE